MASDAMKEVIGHLRRVALLGDGAGPTDGKLLGSFIDDRDQTAFEALVRRHGPMVLGVCRRVLHNQQDAEDAFQATFFVLVRKAGFVVPREMVGNWLYGVARQTALRARALNARRRGREKQVTVMPEPEATIRESPDDLLDQELSHLPDKYRVPIVLCDLEGRTRKEAARQLGWPEGSVSSRLARGRAMLARRLVKRGLVLSGEALAIFVSQNAASASLPAALVSLTVKAATIMAAGQTAASTLISAKVAAITEGVLTSMLLTKLKTVAVVSLIVGVLGVGVGASFLAGQTPGEDGQPAAVRKTTVPGTKVELPTANKQREEGAVPKEFERLRQVEDRFQKEIVSLAKQTDELRMQVKELRMEVNMLHKNSINAAASKPSAKKEIKMFSLRNLRAEEVGRTLEQLFAPSWIAAETQASYESRKPLRIATSPSTNTLIVQGSRDDLESIEVIITRLEATPLQPETLPAEKKGK
jgi:RNA polymerase sigma factor (sigma-70 family)